MTAAVSDCRRRLSLRTSKRAEQWAQLHIVEPASRDGQEDGSEAAATFDLENFQIRTPLERRADNDSVKMKSPSDPQSVT